MLGAQHVLAAPDRMIFRKRTQLVVLFGKDLFHELFEAGVELAAAAAGVGEDEAALLDEVPEVLPCQSSEFGRLVAVEEDDRRLEQLGNAGDGGIDDLPGEQVFPVVRNDVHDVSNVVRVVVPVAGSGRGAAC